MKKFIKNIAIFLLPSILFVVVLLIIPLNKEFAFHFIKGNCYNHGEWLYQRIFENQAPVDVAFIGSSRTLHAVNDKALGKTLSGKTGSDLNVVNFGFCQQGRNFQYAVLKDLLKHKHPKLVIIEITEDERRSTHQSYPYIADARDIVFSPCLNSYYWTDLVKAIAVRWEQLKFNLFFKTDLNSKNASLYGYSSIDRVVTNDELKQNREYWNKRILRDHKSFWGKFLDSYPKYFLEKTIDLLNEDSVEFCFLFIPTANVDIENSLFDSYYQQFGKCYYLKPSKYSDQSLWLDASHFNDEGSLKVIDELSEFVMDELCLKPLTQTLPSDDNSGLQSEPK